MKRLLSCLLMMTIGLLLISPAVQAAGPAVTVLVNGKKIAFPDQQPFIDANKRTLVPVRFVSEALNAVVDWETASNTVTIVQGDKNIKLRIGENKALINGGYRSFDTRAVLKNGRTMVPLRFVSEVLGAKVEWVAKTNTVRITVNNGYTLPSKTDLGIELLPENDNPNKIDISIYIELDKPTNQQFDDAYSIVASKYGQSIAQEVVDYARKKNIPDEKLEIKDWKANNQTIRVLSSKGNWTITIIVWLPGAV